MPTTSQSFSNENNLNISALNTKTSTATNDNEDNSEVNSIGNTPPYKTRYPTPEFIHKSKDPNAYNEALERIRIRHAPQHVTENHAVRNIRNALAPSTFPDMTAVNHANFVSNNTPPQPRRDVADFTLDRVQVTNGNLFRMNMRITTRAFAGGTRRINGLQWVERYPISLDHTITDLQRALRNQPTRFLLRFVLRVLNMKVDFTNDEAYDFFRRVCQPLSDKDIAILRTPNSMCLVYAGENLDDAVIGEPLGHVQRISDVRRNAKRQRLANSTTFEQSDLRPLDTLEPTIASINQTMMEPIENLQSVTTQQPIAHPTLIASTTDGNNSEPDSDSDVSAHTPSSHRSSQEDCSAHSPDYSPHSSRLGNEQQNDNARNNSDADNFQIDAIGFRYEPRTERIIASLHWNTFDSRIQLTTMSEDLNEDEIASLCAESNYVVRGPTINCAHLTAEEAYFVTLEEVNAWYMNRNNESHITNYIVYVICNDSHYLLNCNLRNDLFYSSLYYFPTGIEITCTTVSLATLYLENTEVTSV
jgi:hypothetical protein